MKKVEFQRVSTSRGMICAGTPTTRCAFWKRRRALSDLRNSVPILRSIEIARAATLLPITEIAEGIQTIEEAITQNDITDEDTLSLLAAQKQLFVAASLNPPLADIQRKLEDLEEPNGSKDNYES